MVSKRCPSDGATLVAFDDEGDMVFLSNGLKTVAYAWDGATSSWTAGTDLYVSSMGEKLESPPAQVTVKDIQFDKERLMVLTDVVTVWNMESLERIVPEPLEIISLGHASKTTEVIDSYYVLSETQTSTSYTSKDVTVSYDGAGYSLSLVFNGATGVSDNTYIIQGKSNVDDPSDNYVLLRAPTSSSDPALSHLQEFTAQVFFTGPAKIDYGNYYTSDASGNTVSETSMLFDTQSSENYKPNVENHFAISKSHDNQLKFFLNGVQQTVNPPSGFETAQFALKRFAVMTTTTAAITFRDLRVDAICVYTENFDDGNGNAIVSSNSMHVRKYDLQEVKNKIAMIGKADVLLESLEASSDDSEWTLIGQNIDLSANTYSLGEDQFSAQYVRMKYLDDSTFPEEIKFHIGSVKYLDDSTFPEKIKFHIGSAMQADEIIESAQLSGDALVIGTAGANAVPTNHVHSNWPAGTELDPFGNPQTSVQTSLERTSSSALTMDSTYYSIAYFKADENGQATNFKHATNDDLSFTPSSLASLTLTANAWYMSVGVIQPPSAAGVGDYRAMNTSLGKIYRVSDSKVVASNIDRSLYPTLSTVHPIEDAIVNAAKEYTIDLGDVYSVFKFDIAPQYAASGDVAGYWTDFSLSYSVDGASYEPAGEMTQGFSGVEAMLPSIRKTITLASGAVARYLKISSSVEGTLRLGNVQGNIVPKTLAIQDVAMPTTTTTSTVPASLISEKTEPTVISSLLHRNFVGESISISTSTTVIINDNFTERYYNRDFYAFTYSSSWGALAGRRSFAI